MKRYFIRTECSTKDCPAWKKCNKISAEVNEVKGKVDTLFIGEGAGKDEDEKGYPFAGASGVIIRNIISGVNRKNKGYAFDNLVRFWPKDEEGETRAPRRREIESCLPHLLRNIKRINPKRICFIGTTANKQFFKNSRSITLDRGLVRKVEIEDKTYTAVSTYHPAAALWSGSPDLLSIIKTDIDRALNEDRVLRISKNFALTRVYTIKKAKRMFKYFRSGKVTRLAFDLEADNLNRRYDNRPLSIGFSTGKRTWAVPLYHPKSPFSPEEVKWILSEIKKLASEKLFEWIAHNSKFDRSLLRSFCGISHFAMPVLDTMAYAFILDECRVVLPTESLSLKYLARNEFQYQGYKDETVLEARQKGSLAEVPLKEHCYYVGEDAYVTASMFKGQLKMAEWQNYKRKSLNLLRYFYDKEYTLFVEMERNGIYIDKYRLRELKSPKKSAIIKSMKDLEDRYRKSKAGIETNKWLMETRAAGLSPLFEKPWLFSLGKDAHKQYMFFKALKLKAINEGETGPSLDKDFQEAHKKVPEVAWYTEHQGLKKLKTSYVDAVWNFLTPPDGDPDCQDGYIRPSFTGTKAKTGRGAARDPNSQQIPRGSTEAQVEIRSLYRCKPGRVIIYCDVMTAEVRVWGQEAGDKILCGIFKKGQKLRNKYRKHPTLKLKERAELEGDFHTSTAAEAFGVKPKVAKVKYRQGAKSVSLGRMYGRSLSSIGEQIGKTEDEVAEIDEKVFSKYKRGLQWFFDAEKFAEENHYIESQLGRRRRLLAFLTDNFKLRNEAKRQARNSPIQGYSSDLVFLGAALFVEWIKRHKKDWKVRNTVHDSMMTEVDLKDLWEAIRVIEMVFLERLPKYVKSKFGVKMIVPIEVEFEFGTHLGNLKKWDFSKPHFKELKMGLRKEVRKELEQYERTA